MCRGGLDVMLFAAMRISWVACCLCVPVASVWVCVERALHYTHGLSVWRFACDYPLELVPLHV
jgi:hypothetical protein